MKKASVIQAAAVVVILAMFGCVSKRTTSVQTPKAGKALVKSLPAQVEGVELLGDKVQVKEGFQWVKQPDGTVTVARMAGGGAGSGGTWRCDCTTGSWNCQAVITEQSLRCASDMCLGCSLVITTEGLTTPIIAF